MKTIPTYRVSTEPTIEPVTLAEVKQHLRVDDTFDDDYLTTLIIVARRAVENYIERQLITATITATLPFFTQRRIWLPRPRLIDITSIQYEDMNGDTQTLSSSLYQTDAESTPGAVLPVTGETWPSVQNDNPNAATITYRAGYGDEASDVPQDIRHAILLYCGHYYENRELVTFANAGAKVLPLSSEALLMPYVWFA